MKPLTERLLRSAAERAVAHGHAVGAILFGSRARGTATPDSDWDVCLITDAADPNARGRNAALEADDPFWEDGRIQRVWMASAGFEAGVHAGSLDEAIAREGKVLAGDGAMAKHAKVRPFKAETVRHDMSRAAEQLAEAFVAAQKHARSDAVYGKRQASITMSLRSIGAAEALGRALCMLTGTPHTGTHALATNAKRIRDRAGEPGAPLGHALVEKIGTALETLNGESADWRGAEYGRPPEPHEQARERLVRALRIDGWIRRGLVLGDGPWAGLKDHPRRGELHPVIGEDTESRARDNAWQWPDQQFGALDHALGSAGRGWMQACMDVASVRESGASTRTSADEGDPGEVPEATE